ncbi:hypothetical protein CC86DRAFT_292865 [Ophiobolus disseminans]|uniref:AA1-like domain-containing protein n=1 Tax=Ophiobolus disseminans TaxID=1469910 RepID=A0A6A6ZZR7_9PLEO|nr:hypothetical protein CC86DRAFT_292865 [Ophiobolus disseminans]
MLFAKMIIAGVLSFACMITALPGPHIGMVENNDLRDVGVVYSKANYQGTTKFVFELKNKSDCLDFDDTVLSIKICKQDVECVFYTGSSCNASNDNFAVAIGCGDVAEVKTPKGNHFKRYRCGKPGAMGSVNFTVPTTPHVVGADDGGAMGI